MCSDRLQRREFITLLGGTAAAWPLAARAQQAERVRRIGVLMNLASDDAEGQARLAAFHQGLQQLGWTVGRNVQIDYRWGAGNADRIRKFAAELVALAPDVILSTGSPSVAALQQATHTVPIVFVTVVDPVSSGFVDSLARPGGNITGFALYEYSISGKWLGLLKEIAPGITRAAVIRDPALTAGGGQLGVIQAVAPSVGAEVTPINVRDAGEIERAITTFARSPNGVLIVTGSTLAGVHRDLIVTLAQIARRLLRTLLRRWRWFDVLWAWTRRPIPGCRRIRGSYPQRREAGRPSGAGTDQVRVGDQPQDREGARPHSAR